MVADMELTERDGVGVDVTREGIVTELEGEVNVVSCDVGVAAGVLDMPGIWLVSEKGSNDIKSPEPKSPEPSGNSGVIETIGMLLLDRVFVVIGVMETIGVLLLITLLVAIVSAVTGVISIRVVSIPGEVKACEVG